jgi:hypothetical protein
MHFWRINVPSFARSIKFTHFEKCSFVLLLCGILGIASKLLVSSETKASQNAMGSNSDEPPGSEVHGKALPGLDYCMGDRTKRKFKYA